MGTVFVIEVDDRGERGTLKVALVGESRATHAYYNEIRDAIRRVLDRARPIGVAMRFEEQQVDPAALQAATDAEGVPLCDDCAKDSLVDDETPAEPAPADPKPWPKGRYSIRKTAKRVVQVCNAKDSGIDAEVWMTDAEFKQWIADGRPPFAK